LKIHCSTKFQEILSYLENNMEIRHLTRITYIVVNLSNEETLFIGEYDECENYIWSEIQKLEREYLQ